MAWATPKTDWNANYVPSATDTNRIEENTQELRTPTEGSNQRMGVVSFSGGMGQTVVVSNTSVTSVTRIFLTINSYTGDSTTGAIAAYVVSRIVGTSFTIKIGGPDITLSGTIAWKLYEPHS
jgi:hypothetical protein